MVFFFSNVEPMLQYNDKVYDKPFLEKKYDKSIMFIT